MSLRVWLPLIEDFTNQGISDLTPTLTTGNTFTTPGKIGNKSLHLTQLQTILPNSSASCMYGAKQLSYAYWVKVNTAWSANWLDGIRWIETDGSATATARQEFYTNCTLIGTWYKGGSISGKALTPGEWTHLAATFDYTTGTVKFYINGTLVGTTTNLDTTYHCRGDFYIGDNGVDIQENDVRIYDHCLSAAEVREISQGLVLHYKLDGGLFGNSNLLLNTHFDNRYNQTTGWDTTKNGTLLAYSWGGYNPGVANQATCYHAHLKLFNNEYVYEYIKDTETWLGISQGGLQSKLIAGKTYTFSCEQYSVTNTNYMYGGLYYYKTGATSAGFHLGYINCNTNRQQNTWQKYTYTFTAPSDGDYSKNMIWYCYGHSGGTGTFYLRHLKLEEGNAATPWCPADSELDIDRTIVEDSSGYNHNGSIVGDLIPITDTKRYTIATKWNSSAPTTNNNTGLCYIQTPLTLTTPSQMTITWWGKPESGYGGSTGHAVFCTSNNETAPTDYNTTAFHHRDSGFDIYPSDGSGVKRLSFSYTKNEWHHYAVTYDGTTARTYQDGELKSSIEVGANKTLASFSQLYIGFSKAGGIWRKTLGSYSDFRIYITQLLDTDIKQLYNVGMKIDKGQNVHTFEFNESAGKTQFLKTGVIKSAQVADNLLFDNKAHIGKHSYENILPNNVNIVTTKNGHITNQGTLASIPAEKMQSLAGKALRFTYDVKADGARSSAENNQTTWNYVRYGIHGGFQYTNASGTAGTAYPFAGDLVYSGAVKRSTQTWTVPTGYQSYGALNFSVQAFDKPASTNNETWFIQNVRLEIIDTTSDGYITGTQIIEK